jgi:predicted permease
VFRERFGAEMADLFDAHYQDAQRQGRMAVLSFWCRTIADIAAQTLTTRRGMFRELSQDARFGLRLLRRRPGMAATAIVTLALGVGVNIAAFSVVHATLLRPLPFASPDELVRVGESAPGETALHAMNPGNYADLRALTTSSFESIAAYRRPRQTTLTDGGGDPVSVAVVDARPEFFDVLEVTPALGRLFNASDLANPKSVIVSEAFWRSRLGADPGAIGRRLELDSQLFTVVGVLRDGQEFPAHTEIWRPLAFAPEELSVRSSWNLQAIGRMRPGVPLAQANADLARSMAVVTREHPGPMARTAAAVGLRDDLTDPIRDQVMFAQGIALMLLLITCANLANLTLTSLSSRRAELAVRASIGAGRGRLVRQLLTESLVLGVIGSVGGAMLASLLVPALVHAYPGFLPGREFAGVRWTELAAAMATALATAALFGTIPASLAGRAGASAAAPSSVRVGRSRSTAWLQQSVIAIEVVIALTLVAGSFLLIRSFAGLVRQPIGFSSDGVIAVELQMSSAVAANDDGRRHIFADLQDAFAHVAGVDRAATVFPAPFDLASMGSSFRWDPALGVDAPVSSERRYASEGYLDALSIPLMRGRFFTAADDDGAPLVAVVNESFAKRYGPSVGDVVGKRFLSGNQFVTIVGVIADIRTIYTRPEQPAVVFPHAQGHLTMGTFLLSTSMPAHALDAALQRIRRERAPRLLIGPSQSLDELIGSSVSDRRFNMALLTAVAGLALVLAVVGIYGVMAHAMSERRREMAIRIAMGAAPSQIRRLSLRHGLAPLSVGLAGGLAGAWLLTSLLRHQVFGVTPHDPWTLAAASAAFVSVGLLACWVPARRSTRADPASLLRSE